MIIKHSTNKNNESQIYYYKYDELNTNKAWLEPNGLLHSKHNEYLKRTDIVLIRRTKCFSK